jgi:hypothetical protein
MSILKSEARASILVLSLCAALALAGCGGGGGGGGDTNNTNSNGTTTQPPGGDDNNTGGDNTTNTTVGPMESAFNEFMDGLYLGAFDHGGAAVKSTTLTLRYDNLTIFEAGNIQDALDNSSTLALAAGSTNPRNYVDATDGNYTVTNLAILSSGTTNNASLQLGANRLLEPSELDVMFPAIDANITSAAYTVYYDGNSANMASEFQEYADRIMANGTISSCMYNGVPTNNGTRWLCSRGLNGYTYLFQAYDYYSPSTSNDVIQVYRYKP